MKNHSHLDRTDPRLDSPAWPKRDYQAIVFDCDGTLVDSMPLHFLAWRSTMSRLGIEFTEDRFYALAGVPTDRIIRMLSEEQQVSVDPATASQEKEEEFLTLLHRLQPIEAVVEVARHHRSKLRMGVASGGYRSIVIQQLTQVGCHEWFDCIVAAEDTAKHKPEPDVFLEAARRLNAHPAECLVYEDSDLGIQAAVAAGMDWIDVRTFYSPKRVTS